MLAKLYRRVRENRFRQWSSGVAELGRAPYSILLYRQYLQAVARQRDCVWLPFEAKPRPGVTSLYHRHDIDTAACLRNLPALLSIDCELGIPSSVFLRPDDEEGTAKWADAVAVKREYESRGIAVGLHTMSYAYDDPSARLNFEIAKFETTFGNTPRYITFHGTGNKYAAKRYAFQTELAEKIHQFGFVFGDFSSGLRSYHYEVTDCHLDAAGRFCKTDLIDPPPPMTDCSYIFLTHPCYWRV